MDEDGGGALLLLETVGCNPTPTPNPNSNPKVPSGPVCLSSCVSAAQLAPATLALAVRVAQVTGCRGNGGSEQPTCSRAACFHAVSVQVLID